MKSFPCGIPQHFWRLQLHDLKNNNGFRIKNVMISKRMVLLFFSAASVHWAQLGATWLVQPLEPYASVTGVRAALAK